MQFLCLCCGFQFTPCWRQFWGILSQVSRKFDGRFQAFGQVYNIIHLPFLGGLFDPDAIGHIIGGDAHGCLLVVNYTADDQSFVTEGLPLIEFRIYQNKRVIDSLCK